MSGNRLISDSSNMDKEAENMDEIPSSPAFSMISEFSEADNIPISEDINENLDYIDELMQFYDLLEDEEDTFPWPQSAISQESKCSSPDSEISEVITPFELNIDEVIANVCQSYLYSENLDTEADDFVKDKEVQTTETGDSRLAIKSEESARPASCASSSFTNSQLDDEDVKTPEPTKAVQRPEPTEAAWTPEPTKADFLDELMQGYDLLENEEDTFISLHLASSDSEISEVIKPFELNIDEVIAKVCQSYYAENLETQADDFGEDEDVQTTKHTEASWTPEPTKDVQTPEPTEAVQMPEPTETAWTSEPTEDVQTQQPTEAVQTPEPTKVTGTPEPTEDVGTPEPTKAVQTPEPHVLNPLLQWKRCFSGRRRNRIHPAPPVHLDAVKSASADEDQTPEDIRDVSSPSSTSLSPPHHQVVEVTAQPDSEHLSDTKVDADKTKAKRSNRFSCFFRNIFSKNEKKEKKVPSAWDVTKQPPFWIKLVSGGSYNAKLED